VVQQAADVPAGQIRQAAVAGLVGEQRLAVLPDRLVHVHARTVVAEDGLRHEGRGLAIAGRDVVDDVLQDLDPVCPLNQRRELGADLALPGTGDLVVVDLDRHAHLLQDQDHLRAHVLQRIHRRHREVAALHRRTVAAVAALEAPVGGPRRLFGIDLDRTAGHVDMPGDRVEDEELGLRSEIGHVTDAAGLQIRLGAAGQRPRIPLVALAVARLDDVAAENQRRLLAERIHHRGRRIRHQLHVGRLNAFPAGDRRSVERVAIGELVLVEGGDRHGDVLLLAARVGEAEIDEFHFVVRDLLHDVFGGSHSVLSCQFSVDSCERHRDENSVSDVEVIGPVLALGQDGSRKHAILPAALRGRRPN